jgi:SET domain
MSSYFTLQNPLFVMRNFKTKRNEFFFLRVQIIFVILKPNFYKSISSFFSNNNNERLIGWHDKGLVTTAAFPFLHHHYYYPHEKTNWKSPKDKFLVTWKISSMVSDKKSLKNTNQRSRSIGNDIPTRNQKEFAMTRLSSSSHPIPYDLIHHENCHNVTRNFHDDDDDDTNHCTNGTSKTTTDRNIRSLQSWCDEMGIRYDPAIHFHMMENTKDCCLQLLKDGKAGTTIATIPSHLLFSSKRLERLLKNDPDQLDCLQPALDLLQERGFGNQIPQFFIFLQLLIECNRQEASRWYLYIQSLPQKFSTSIDMTEHELNLLPPMAYAIAQTWRLQYNTFQQAIQLIPEPFFHHYQVESTPALFSNIKQYDIATFQWAYNTVFTRCWSYRDSTRNTTGSSSSSSNNQVGTNSNNENESDQDNQERIDLVPFGDMFNHGCSDHEHNIEISYNTMGDCIVTLTKDTQAGTPLLFSYGKATNAYHFLTIFGFVDSNQQELLCQLQLPSYNNQMSSLNNSTDPCSTKHNNKEQVYKDMSFYDPSKMVFRTKDGAIGTVVWDYILYTLLEQNEMWDVQEQFYEAHMQKNTTKKTLIHSIYDLESSILLKKHVDRTIVEMKQLLTEIKQRQSNGYDSVNSYQQ